MILMSLAVPRIGHLPATIDLWPLHLTWRWAIAQAHAYPYGHRWQFGVTVSPCSSRRVVRQDTAVATLRILPGGIRGLSRLRYL